MLFNLPRDAAVAYVLLAIIAGATPVPLMHNDGLVARQPSQTLVDRDNSVLSWIASRSGKERDLYAWEDKFMDSSGDELYSRSGRGSPDPKMPRGSGHANSDLVVVNGGQYPVDVDAVLGYIRYIAQGPPPMDLSAHLAPQHGRSPSQPSRPSSSGSGSSELSDGMGAHWATIDQMGHLMDVWKTKYENTLMQAMQAWEDLLVLKNSATSTDQRQVFNLELAAAMKVAEDITRNSDAFGASLKTAAALHVKVLKKLESSPTDASTKASASNHSAIATLLEKIHGLKVEQMNLIMQRDHYLKSYMAAWREIIEILTFEIKRAQYTQQLQKMVEAQIRYLKKIVENPDGIGEEVKAIARADVEAYQKLDKE
ncbi:hypothetical protein H0H93_000773, partial [Arthromyces matolae]